MNHDCLHLDTIAYKSLPQDGKPFYLINQTVGGTTAFILSIINKYRSMRSAQILHYTYRGSMS